jgi:PAS domain S-box-containing protein
VLDVWLMVVMCAWIFDIALSAGLNSGRFDLGFYSGRVYGLLAATSVLMILLWETGSLYAQFAKFFEAEQRTLRRIAEQHRREAEERNRIFETSLDLILVVDRQGALVRVSPSALAILGYQPAEMIGRSAAEFVCPGDVEAIHEQMRWARHGHLIRNFATRYIHKNGQLVTLAWSGVWSDPEQRHFFIGRDITQQQRIERMKDEFIATVSHELRTPVTSIAAPLGLLLGGAAGDLPQSVTRLLTIAQRNSKRLVRLVNDILDMEKIESGRVHLNFQRVDLRPLVEKAVEENRTFAEEFRVSIRMDSPAVDVAVYSDSARLLQVLSNLVSNAIKFSLPGEETVVSMHPYGEFVRVAVHDHGPGIPVEFQEVIFDKFVQVDASDARQRGGTGLGLSIVKQTMARLGGRVGHDAGPSGGTIFHVDVPRWKAEVLKPELLCPEARITPDQIAAQNGKAANAQAQNAQIQNAQVKNGDLKTAAM